MQKMNNVMTIKMHIRISALVFVFALIQGVYSCKTQKTSTAGKAFNNEGYDEFN